MSVIREENICRIIFTDELWKDAAEDVYTVADGDVPFFVSDTWSYEENTTLRSGVISHNKKSETTITVNFVEDGTLKMAVASSSEGTHDALKIIIDDEEKQSISGITDFVEYEFVMAKGEHTILLRYQKDGSVSKGNDAVALGYIEFIGVEAPYLYRYLLSDFNKKVYTITDGEVKEIPGLEATALKTKDVFVEYGFAKKPEGALLLSLTHPVLYRWSDGDNRTIKAKATAIVKPQTISATADLSNTTIKGIAGMTAVYDGDVTASISYDGTTYTDAVAMADFLKTDADSMYKAAKNKKLYFKFVIGDSSSSLTNFVITYKNS